MGDSSRSGSAEFGLYQAGGLRFPSCYLQARRPSSANTLRTIPRSGQRWSSLRAPRWN